MVALSARRLDRREAGLERDEAGRVREQSAIDRASAEAGRGLAALQPGLGEAIEQSAALRRRVREAIKAFAANEDYVARTYEELADKYPHNEEYRSAAEKARETGREATEILRIFTD